MNIHVLVLDDNKMMRGITRSILRAAGPFDSYEAGDAMEAFELLRTVPVDLIIADFAMQPLDGIEFTRMVRQAPDSQNHYAGIIMMTGHTQISKVKAARNAGVSSFLAKPISPRSLIAHVNAISADKRPFVRTATYFGPDRRIGQATHFAGPLRRLADRGGEVFDVG